MEKVYFNKMTGGQRCLSHCLCFLIVFSSATAEEDEGARDRQIRIEARHLSEKDGVVQAAGDARAFFRGHEFCAETMEYDRAGRLVRARDKVKLRGEGYTIHGRRAQYNLDDGEGSIEEFEAVLAERGWRLRGESAMVSEQQISARDTVLTSCPADSADWQLSVGELTADTRQQAIFARTARFEIAGIPVMFLPYATFNYGGDKKSGFLTPTMHLGSGSGFGANLPYYVYLADHYDWTIAPNWRSRHGLEIANEFRFVTRRTAGTVHLNGVVADEESRDRQTLAFRFDEGPWRLQLNSDNVSDSRYLRDYGDGGDDNAVRNLPRAAMLRYAGDGWSATATAEAFETLDAGLTAPHRLLPMVAVEQSGQGAHVNWTHEAQVARFRHDDAARDDGSRLLWRGTMSGFFHHKRLTVIPSVGLYAAAYRLKDGARASFLVPHARLQTQTRWRNRGENFVPGDYRLRLAYVYAPERRQDDAPLFDTMIKRQTLENIYEWNRYAGGDRAADVNFLAYGLEYTRSDPSSGREQAFFGAAQRYYFRRPRVVIADEVPPEKGLKNILMKARLHWRDNWRAEAEGEWGVDDGSMERFYADVRVRLAARQLVRAGILLDDEESVRLGAASPLGGRLEAAVDVDYLLDGDRFSRASLALNLTDECGCWRLSLKVSDSLVAQDDNDVAVDLAVEFVGLGVLGSDYESVLDDLR